MYICTYVECMYIRKYLDMHIDDDLNSKLSHASCIYVHISPIADVRKLLKGIICIYVHIFEYNNIFAINLWPHLKSLIPERILK